MPWISASVSNIQSHVRQKGLCQRTATNAKLIALHAAVGDVHDQDVADGQEHQHAGR